MAKRFKFNGTYRPQYLRHWRELRGFNLKTMARMIAEMPNVNGALSKASLSRIERGLTPFTRDTLEVYAIVCRCEPVELLTRPPPDPEGIWTVWKRLLPRERIHAIAMIEAVFIQDGGERPIENDDTGI
jgi:transcriptional regulator with XRE-family HTH domain